MIEPIIPSPQRPNNGSSFTIKKIVGAEAVSQATLIIKAHGLNYLQSALIQLPNSDKMALERDALAEGMKNRNLSEWGAPVFDVFTFARKEWTTLDGEQLTVAELALGTVLVDISQSKNIVKTAIQGRNGTVKEWTSDGDYLITIRGVLTSGAQDVYPVEQVEHMRDFFVVNESLQIGNDYLNRWNITDIVITDFSLGQEEGNRSIQRFEIQALSDYPYEVKGKKI